MMKKNEISKNHGLVYLNGFETMKGKDITIAVIPEIGILVPEGAEIPDGATAEVCAVASDGMVDSRLLAMEINGKGTLSCIYDEETGCYYWVRSEALLKDVLRRAAGLQ